MTPANTGLDNPSEYPEFGSAFKAASMKLTIWFLAKLSMELAQGSEALAKVTNVLENVLRFL